MVRLADVVAVRVGQRTGEHISDLVVDAPSVGSTATLLKAVTDMDTYEVDCLLVMDGDRIVGLVTRDDAIRLDQIVARTDDDRDST